MAARHELEGVLLRTLLESELERFQRDLESEDPGLSKAEVERYMRAARKFANQLTGTRSRTRGRQARPRAGHGPAES